jgi:predicted oxidoreductase
VLKIHVAVDIEKKKIVSLDVTSEEVHDSKMLKSLVDSALENNDIKMILADAAYDSKLGSLTKIKSLEEMTWSCLTNGGNFRKC